MKRLREDESGLREFPEWPLERVMEVAQMLYALRPFNITGKSQIQWNSLAREAFDFLDYLHQACEKITKRRTLQDAAYRRAETRTTAAEKLPEIVPFDKALLFITREQRTKRAQSKFEKFVRARWNQAELRRLNAQQIRRWRKTGIPRHTVMELQAEFDNSWRSIVADENRNKAKKRGPKLNPKHKAVIREVLREKNQSGDLT
jgi:hypothetical protein